MFDEIEIEKLACVGVAFGNKVIYNIVEKDAEFINTGLSICNYLIRDRNKFVSRIIESQSYDGISIILDDEIRFNKFYDSSFSTIDNYSTLLSLMEDNSIYEYFYIYDYVNDMLIVKTPLIKEPVALNYKSATDVRDFIKIS